MAAGVMLLRSMQNTRRSWAEREAKYYRHDVAAGRRRLHIKAVCQSVREATTASGVDNAALPTGRHPLNGIICTLRERLITMQNNWKEPRSILMKVEELPISTSNSCNYCEQYTRASSGV